MNARRRLAVFVILTTCLLTGCVERRFVITTTAPGLPPDKDLSSTIIDEKGMVLSASPADKPFIYYGKYRFIAVKDGFQTTIHDEDAKPPWFEYFPLDFVSENLIPWTIRDVRRVQIVLQPLPMVPPEMVLQQGQALRQRGQAIGVPLPGGPVMMPSP
jgi:hypothetical protein